MMRALPMLLALASTACTGAVYYERGLPKRVEVKKSAAPGIPKIAVRQRGEQVSVYVNRQQDVRLERRIVFRTIEVRHEYGGPLVELFEFPVGLMAIIPVLLSLPTGALEQEDTPYRKVDRTKFRLALVFGPLNPAQTFFYPDIVRDPTSDEEHFFSRPAVTNYTIAPPVPGAKVSYVVRDAAGKTVLEGEAKTDAFGRIAFEVPPTATRVEARTSATRVETSLRPRPTSPEPVPAGPVPEAPEKAPEKAATDSEPARSASPARTP